MPRRRGLWIPAFAGMTRTETVPTESRLDVGRLSSP